MMPNNNPPPMLHPPTPKGLVLVTRIRRVPLGFDWPLHQIWEGYLQPAHLRLSACPDCRHDGRRSTGLSAAAHAIDVAFYATDVSAPLREQICWHDKISQAEVNHLLKKGRLQSWEDGTDGERGRWVVKPITAAEVNARQTDLGLGSHDASNRFILVEYRCKRLGIPVMCATCQGRTRVGTPEQVAANKAWKPTHPPRGKGWQAWEDTSEGSPISPVFATDDALIDWFASPASRSASTRYPLTHTQAVALVRAGGSTGTAVLISGQIVDADRAVAVLATNT